MFARIYRYLTILTFFSINAILVARDKGAKEYARSVRRN